MALEGLAAGDLNTLLANPWVLSFIVLAAAWKFAWYGVVLWEQIQNKNKKLFIIFLVLMMILNDLGIVPIVYLIVQKYKKNDKTK